MNVFAWQHAPVAAFAVIGSPISHSLSPKMHTAALAAMHIEAEYVAIDVPIGEVAAALDHLHKLGYLGINVTVPHKEAALAWCKVSDEFSKSVRAVNTIRMPQRQGTNTDGPGFIETISGRIEPGSPCLILGAGGSARAVAMALVQSGFPVAVSNRTISRAEELVAALGPSAMLAGPEDIRGAQLVINATSAQAKGEVSAFDWTQYLAVKLAYDLMYSTGPTLFLSSSREAHPKLSLMDGKALLVAQGALALEFWTGKIAPRDVMSEAIR